MLTLYYLMKKSKSKSRISSQYYQDLFSNGGLKIMEDISSKCRVCLQEGSILIFGNENTTDILGALEIIADIQITENDYYPKYLCNVCHDFIQVAVMFKHVAKQSDLLLKKPVTEEIVYEEINYDNDFSDGDNFNDAKDIKTWPSEDNCQIKNEKEPRIILTPKVTCKVCNKVINRSYYKQHKTMHDPNHKKYVCDVCGKSFRLRCAYHNHSLRHGNDFPYKCQFCPYKGRYSELLKTHMRTHTGDYRYMCTECPARFLFKSNLNSHMLKHKEPQFKCESCKRAFHTKQSLQRHFEADHLGIKNHVCNICGKAFGYRNAMMKHQRRVHKREKISFGRRAAYLEAEDNNDE